MKRIVIYAVSIALVAGSVGGWALRSLSTSTAVNSPEDFAYAAAEERTVSDGLSVVASATWHEYSVGTSHAVGTVTTLDYMGGPVLQGQILYTVDMEPVVVIFGSIPAYRDLTLGDTGADVSQVQDMLISRGLLSAPADGSYGPATAHAVAAFRTSVGLKKGADLELIHYVVVPRDSVLLLESSAIEVGAPVTGGERLVVATSSPYLSIKVASSQAAALDEGDEIEIPHNGRTITGRLGPAQQSEGDVSYAVLFEGSEQCPSDCLDLSASAESVSLDARVVTVPETTGVSVPASAIEADPDTGDLFVTTDLGERRVVNVRAVAQGFAVISGVDAGTRVRLPVSVASGPTG